MDSSDGMYSTTTSAGQPPSLASIYQAKKSGDNTVEMLKRQFQDQIERILHEKGQVTTKAHIPSNNEREVREFKKLHREKSFDEARTAVQTQIEKMFQKAAAKQIMDTTTGQNGANNNRRFMMHGKGELKGIDRGNSPVPESAVQCACKHFEHSGVV